MQVLGILETAIHVRDIEAAVAFYERLFGFQILDKTDQFCALDAGPRSVLLMFKVGTSHVAKPTAGGVIPPHEGDCPTHFAFSIAAADLNRWEARLAAKGVALESRVEWPRGGTSLYFRDPDQNLLELATPGVWVTY